MSLKLSQLRSTRANIKKINYLNCIGIEHKMGLKASPTTTLSFGEKGSCCGYLLGKEREGIRIKASTLLLPACSSTRSRQASRIR